MAKKLGWFLIIAPIIIFLIIAIAHGFTTANCWLGNPAGPCGADWFGGILGAIVLVVGIILAKGKKESE